MTTEHGPARDPESRAGRPPPASATGRPALLEQLRDANEHLVVSSMRAQDQADEATVSRNDAEAANRMKDEFLAVVSHELRTPLNAVLAWAHLLGTGRLDPARTANALLSIERNARALARIIDDLLDVSRIIAGSIRIEPQPVDLVAVIQDALDEIRPTAEAGGVTVTFTCQAVPDPIGGDAQRLQQVMANLLSNALKFTAAGGRVEVRLAPRGDQAEIQVADTGQGIDPAFLPHLFERFTQGDTSTTRRHGGIGLGLAIVKALVEQHGGTVHADSPGMGRGATFTVRLPALPTDGVDRRGGEQSPARASARVDGIRVLLAEDDADGREVIRTILEMAGATVETAASVREALQALDELRPDVLITDIGMPDEDGYALIRRLRARGGDHGGGTPAIALTGYVTPEDRDRLQGAGFQLHLPKPVEPSEVVAAVASLATRGST